MNDGSPLDSALDAYGPARIAERVESAGIGKAALGVGQLLTLAVLAGAFIGFGGIFYLLALTGADPGVGVNRIIGGLAFSLGLVLVIVAGAELFTGNALIVIAWADGAVRAGALLRNWSIAYVGNFVGAFALAWAVVLAGTLEIGGGALRALAIDVARVKTELEFGPAFVRGVLCNILVCLAVWMCFSARATVGKIFCIVFPITAFVALGFEHSIANMFLIPLGMLAGEGLDFAGLFRNLLPVTLGNIVGGGVLVAAVYWLVYRHGAR